MSKKSIYSEDQDRYILHLYVSGMSPKSMEAIENINHLCDEYLNNSYELDIIDIYKHPESAIQHHIVFSPSLIKLQPLPRKTLIGTLSNKEKVLETLGITSKKDL